MKYKSIDLFAGIGGIRLGFEKAFKEDVETVFVSEWDVHAQKTYKANFNDKFEMAGDITAVDEKEIPEFDICLAGFPCQAFSMAGKRQGFDDDYKGMCRGTLFLDVARICEEHKPKVIFAENVKGLVIHDKGRTFQIIKKTFENLGYTVHTNSDKTLNSKDFGVPQNRERIYIVAFRNDIDSSMFKFPKATDTGKTIKDIMEKEPVSVKYYLSTTYMDTLRRHRARHETKGNGFGYEIRSLDGIAGSIVCGGMGRERNLIIDDRLTDFTPITHIKGEVNREGIRKMTPREWARLQGFPDDYKLPLADVHLYKQFGNTVTVPVIEAIANEIKEVLDHANKNNGEQRQIHDVQTGFAPVCGFSIKSEVGNPPTLINATGATNFIYEVIGLSDEQINSINAIETKTKIKDRMSRIYSIKRSMNVAQQADMDLHHFIKKMVRCM